ncbi:MAG TPA: hypothetical protein DCY79_25385 [Planctomycetaceae bacterium]|nr:hypothetical protein [Blastopirellula sp.]HAY83153.1 hypothetical protein [Planctomycetaceae bacterium]
MSESGLARNSGDSSDTQFEQLAQRARAMDRRSVLKAGQALAFITPAIAVYGVPRRALGQTGSGTSAPLLGPDTFGAQGAISGKAKGKGKTAGKGKGKGK